MKRAWLLLTALAVAVASGARADDPRELFEQAVLLQRQARFEEARAAAETAVIGFETAGDQEGRANALLVLAGIFRDVGDLASSERSIDQALESLPESAAKIRARGLQQRAQLRSRKGDGPGARSDLDESAVLYRQLGMEAELAEVEATAAIIASWQGEYQAAVNHARAALPRLATAGAARYRVGALAALAYGLQELGELHEAIEVYERLIVAAFERNDQRNLNFAFCNRADLRWKLGEPRGSEEDLERALDGFEAARLRIWGGPEERREYLSRQIRAYDRMVLLLAKTHRGVDAFQVAERFHARSFLELLEETDLDRAGRRIPELRRRERDLLTALAGQQTAGVGDELVSVRSEMRRADPRYGELVEPQPLDAEAVQKALAPDEALVAYWVSEELVLAWTLTPEKTSFLWIPVARAELEQAIAHYLEPLRSADRARDLFLTGEEGEHLDVGRRLYGWLVAPLPEPVREASTLIVVPDGNLYHLPFEALPSDCAEENEERQGLHAAYAGCSYLGLERALVYASSASVFSSLRRRSAGRPAARPASAIAMAPFVSRDASGAAQAIRAGLGALQYSGQEIEQVAHLFDGSEALTGPRATEARLKRSAAKHGVIHLATHGVVDDERPMTSGLLLRPGQGEDGLFQAHEVLGLDLAANLVTLSACRSGRGELSRAEGWVGLTRSFLYAGAERVVASLWDVDDQSTPTMMAALYRALVEGASPAEALRQARAELAAQTGEGGLVFRRRTVHYAHPRFWAGFTLHGLP